MVVLIAAFAISPQGDLYSRVVPRTTGRNGYEEYVRAAALVENPEVQKWVLLDLQGGKNAPVPNGLPAEATTLERHRWVLKRLQPAFDLVKLGNEKPVADPREAIGLSTILPEFAPFSHLGRAFAGAAYAEYAAGKTAQGTDRLLAGLTFGENISRTGILAAHLMGVMQMNVIFSAFDARLPQLSQDDCRQVLAKTNALMERPNPYPTILAKEREIYLRAVNGMVAGERAWDEEGNYAEVTDRLQGLSPDQREEVRRSVVAGLETFYRREVRKYQAPESQWPIGGGAEEDGLDDEPDSTGTPHGLAQRLVRLLTPNRDSIGVTSLRARTQLRLLRLHARILAFRWEHDRLPATLAEAAPTREIGDPVNDETFEYRRTDEGYRLISRGRPGIGEIALRYVRPTPSPVREVLPPR